MRPLVLASALVLVMAAVPQEGYAYNNSLEFWLGSGSGDFSEPGVNADVELAEFGLSYTHYFSHISTGSGPYGERVFLQHPSELSVELSGFGMEVTFMGDKLEFSEGAFGISGIYYFPNKRTGLGLAFESISGENKFTSGGIVTGEEEESIGAARLFVHHYIADAVRIGLSIQGEESETKETFPGSGVTDKYEQSLLEIYADALLDDRFKLGVFIAGGEREYTFPAPAVTSDVSEVGLRAGIYFSKTTGLFLAYENMKEDGNGFENTTDATTLAVDHYFTEAVHAALSVIWMSSEETSGGTTGELDATAIEILVGFLF